MPEPVSDLQVIDALNRIADKLEDSTLEVAALRTDVKGESQSRNRKTVVIILGVVVLIMLAVLNYQTISAANRQTRFITSCTTPTGECYKAGQAANAQNRNRLNQYNYVLTYCDVQNNDLAKWQECVIKNAPANTPTSLPNR